MTRAEAKALGLKVYTTGKPCKRGHYAERRVKDGYCQECCRERKRALRKLTYEKSPMNIWAGRIVTGSKKRAREYKIPHTITADYVRNIITDTCPVFGVKFNFLGFYNNENSPSIDRLDPKLGYVQGNVAIISRKANVIKNAYRSEDILKVGKWLKSRGL